MGEPPPTVLLLELVEGPLAGNTLQGDASQAKKYQVGRTRTSKKFQIKDPSISEKHAEIIVRDGQWLLRDLGSSNGTMVNEQQLPEKGEHIPLKSGDTIRFGQDTVAKVTIQLVLGDDVTVEQYLQAEVAQLELQIKARAEMLAQQIRQDWAAAKQQLLAMAQ